MIMYTEWIYENLSLVKINAPENLQLFKYYFLYFMFMVPCIIIYSMK